MISEGTKPIRRQIGEGPGQSRIECSDDALQKSIELGEGRGIIRGELIDLVRKVGFRVQIDCTPSFPWEQQASSALHPKPMLAESKVFDNRGVKKLERIESSRPTKAGTDLNRGSRTPNVLGLFDHDDRPAFPGEVPRRDESVQTASDNRNIEPTLHQAPPRMARAASCPGAPITPPPG